MFKVLTTILLSTILMVGSTDKSGYTVGDKAMDFNLKNVDGKMISMAANSANKGYIVIFTCNTCPYSVAYEDRIIDLHNKYAAMGYPVIAINPNDPVVQPGDSFENMQVRAQEKEFPFPYVLDATQEVTIAYGATNTPHVYILNKENDAFIVKYVGAIDNNSRDASAVTKKYVEDAMTALMASKPVETSSTKAIGCTIKWSEASKKKRAEM